MFYFLWVPVLIAYYVFYAWLSIKSNNNAHWGWFWGLVVTQAFGLWPLVSRYSKNLFFDAILFDIIIILSFMASMSIFGAGQEFKWYQWVGFILSILGLILMKVQFTAST